MILVSTYLNVFCVPDAPGSWHCLFIFITVVYMVMCCYMCICPFVSGLEQTSEEEHPSQVAETVFRDLVCRASYGNINAVIRPVLT